MEAKLLPDERTFVVRLERGDEVVEALTAFARDREVGAARVSGIGALGDAELGFYDLERKDYHRFEVTEDTELVSLLGNLTLLDGEPRVHLHAALGRRDGSLVGGHLFRGHVGPTLEAFVVAAGEAVHRQIDQEIGLPLIRP